MILHQAQEEIKKHEIYVIDIAKQEEDMQAFVFGNVMRAVYNLKLGDYEKENPPRIVIFIDELSWMDTPKCDLMIALENFWNAFASARKDIVLIVCASATSWMLSKVVHNKGGLYNRLTEQINLQTFSLKECEDYIKANLTSLKKEAAKINPIKAMME